MKVLGSHALSPFLILLLLLKGVILPICSIGIQTYSTMKCETTLCLYYIIYYMSNSWTLYSVGFMEWGGGSEECKEVWQLKHFCPFLFVQFFKNREYYFGTLPLLPQLVILLGQLLKEAKVGLHLPVGVQNDFVIIRL